MNYRGTIAYRSADGGKVDELFCASLVQAWDFMLREPIVKEMNYPLPIYFMRGLSCMLHDSANQIAQGFLGGWVLFLDTDHVFGADALYEMVRTFEENNLDILTGFTQKRQAPYTPILYRTNFHPLRNFEPVIPKGIDRHVTIPIDAGGLACLMVRRTVFDKIAERLGERPFDFRLKFKPPCHIPNIPVSTVWQGSNYDPDSHIPDLPKDRRWDEFYWEDVSFYWRAKILGYQAWCAPWIKFHHIETRLVDESLIQAPVALDPRIPV